MLLAGTRLEDNSIARVLCFSPAPAGTYRAGAAYYQGSGDRKDFFMYNYVYWAGVTVLVLWTAVSAYSVITGL